MHTRIADPESVVERQRRPMPIPDEKIFEVAGTITGQFVRAGVPASRDEIYQEAALWALETRAQYGHTIHGNPFNYLAFAAGTRTKIATIQQLSPASMSSFAAAGRVRGVNPYDLQRRVPLLKKRGDGGGRDEEWMVSDERPEVGLRGELERLRSVVALFRRLEVRERRLVVAAMADREGDLHSWARRCKLPRARAARVIGRFVRAVGHDPAVAHLRRVISAA